MSTWFLFLILFLALLDLYLGSISDFWRLVHFCLQNSRILIYEYYMDIFLEIGIFPLFNWLYMIWAIFVVKCVRKNQIVLQLGKCICNNLWGIMMSKEMILSPQKYHSRLSEFTFMLTMEEIMLSIDVVGLSYWHFYSV